MYRRASWVDPRLVARSSRIAGRGLFARGSMAAGEPVVVWGGELVSVYRKSCVAIGKGLYLDGPPDESDFLNPSCDPNVWMHDAVTLVARRDIPMNGESVGQVSWRETAGRGERGCSPRQRADRRFKPPDYSPFWGSGRARPAIVRRPSDLACPAEPARLRCSEQRGFSDLPPEGRDAGRLTAD